MLPLNGINVVEMGVMIAVPGASATLVGLGANVIKVEDTRRGDELRSYGSTRGGMSGWFANVNAGKQSIAVDLQTESGKEIFWQLLEEADVLIQGFRAGVLGKLGFDYETVAARLPGLIYCSSTGFGETGPYADQPAFDPIVQALSGWAGIQQVDGNPTLHKTMVSDKTAAAYNAMAIMAALVQRGNTGKGCYIEASMLESNIMFNWPDVMMQCTLLDDDARHIPNIFSSYRLYECTDGWVTIACGTDQQWLSFCTATDRPECAEDPRFKTAADRGGNIAEFFNMTAELAAPFDSDTLVARLRAADVPVAPVHAPEAVKEDPHVQARGFIREVEHPVAGRFLSPQTPASMFGQANDPGPAPVHGEQTRSILENLGFDDEQIAKLQASGVIKCIE